METVKIMKSGFNQTVCLPVDYRFSSDEVYIQKVGKAVLLVPKDDAWEVFMNGINDFPDDFMKDGRCQGDFQEREPI